MGRGNKSEIRVFNGAAVLLGDTNNLLFKLRPFPTAVSGVRVATGLVSNDGQADLIVTRGAGEASQVRVFDGANPASVLAKFKAFTGTKGLYVAAGDLSGDGLDDIIVGRGAGGQVRVFDVSTPTPTTVLDFVAFLAPTKGVRVAAIDVNDDLVPDILGSAGLTSLVRVFDGTNPSIILDEFEAFPGLAGNFSLAGTGVQ